MRYKRVWKMFRGFQTTNKLANGAVQLAHFVREPRSTSERLGPPLVILHGMMGSKNNWKTISLKIRDGLDHSREIIMLDIRNHGESPWAEDHTLDAMVQDLDLTLKALNLHKPVILGHSMGGRVMMIYALRHPTSISGLAVIEMSYRSLTEPHKRLIEIINFMNTIIFDNNEPVSIARKKADSSLKTIIRSKSMREFLLQNLYKDKDGVIKWRFNLEAIGRSIPQSFPEEAFELQYPGPCLFVGGSESPFLGASDLPQLKKMFPQVQMVIIEGGGHLLHVDKPKEFVHAVTLFLNETLRQAAL